jgi:hypothetical protein
MNAYWNQMEVSGQLHALAALPPGKEPLVPVVLDTVKRKIRSPRRESNPRTLTVQPVAQRYTDWAITDLYISYSDFYSNENR